MIFIAWVIRSGYVFCLRLSMQFSELEFSIEWVRSSEVFGGRLQRPSPCCIRFGRRRKRGWVLSETRDKCDFYKILGGIRPRFCWILPYVELERKNWGQHFQIVIIYKLVSKFVPDKSFIMAAPKRLPYRS